MQQFSPGGIGHEDIDVVRVLPVAEHLDQEFASEFTRIGRKSEQRWHGHEHARSDDMISDEIVSD